MAAKYKIEPRTTGLSRSDVNQLNKIFDSISKDIKAGAAPAAAPKAAGDPPNYPAESIFITPAIGPPSASGGGGGSTSPAGPGFQFIPVVTSTTPYTIFGGDNWLILASATAGAAWIGNLPPAIGSLDMIIVKKMDANAHNVAVTPNGSDVIDGVNAALDITVQYDNVRLIDYASGAWATW